MARPDKQAFSGTTLALIGVALVAVGSVRPWVVYEFGSLRFTYVGLRTAEGFGVLLLALAAGAFALWVRASPQAPEVARHLVLLCGAVATAIVVLTVVAGLTAPVPSFDENVLRHAHSGPPSGLLLALAGTALACVGGREIAKAPRFHGCLRCTERVAPNELPQHLVRSHGLTPDAAIDEANGVLPA